jgi:hypothetical protein
MFLAKDPFSPFSPLKDPPSFSLAEDPYHLFPDFTNILFYSLVPTLPE